MADTGEVGEEGGTQAGEKVWTAHSQEAVRESRDERPVIVAMFAAFVMTFGLLIAAMSLISDLGNPLVLLLLAVGLATAAIGIGLWQLKAWAWELAVILLLMSLTVTLSPFYWFSIVGLALLVYLIKVREYFT